jgi:outer membrane receptor protein involved in Fe transport
MAGAVSAQEQKAAEEKQVEKIQVTGSRIMKTDLVSNSPIVSVDAAELNSRGDVTLDTFINTLPQVNPAGTTTSNNPGNGGQSNVNLRGLGSNRNLVLVDGRRVMPSASDMTVDLNTIPTAMIESLEVVTGGAGAAYGADAVSGAVNLRLKRDFEGFDFRYTNSNHIKERDSKETNWSAVLGGNFDDDKGNAIFGFDYSTRQGMIKAQRPFAAIATSTTTFFPEGTYFSAAGNHPSQAAVDSVFAKYGVGAGLVPAASNLIGFNSDGTLFSRGLFNSPIDVQNWRYPVDLSVNTRLFPDMYSYNFDEVNLLVLPMERKSFMNKLDYQLNDKVRMFSTVSWTNYESVTALAPTPFPTIGTQGPGGTSATRVNSNLVSPGAVVSNQLVIPVTNPFIPADFRTVLNSRTGDNANLAGTGANEAFTIRARSLWGGLRQSVLDNTVTQYMLGFSGDINDAWRWEAYAMQGKTVIVNTQTGNLNGQKLQTLIEAADGGKSICEGGYNPFGRQPVSQACIDYILVANTTRNILDQQIVQGYVNGDLFELETGMVNVVLGAESRKFKYSFDPGALSGPISGLNVASPSAGENEFKDIFAEAYFPLVADAAFADSMDLTLGYRVSESQFVDKVKKKSSAKDRNSSFKAELSWEIGADLPRVRASYQRAVRAPNFSELFDAGSSAPQILDPCSPNSAFRKATGAQGFTFCQQQGIANPNLFAQSPGSQTTIFIGGNTDLQPEIADTITLGTVYSLDVGVTMALDYYNIDIQDAIESPSTNLIIADCFNGFGNNPNLDVKYRSCAGFVRAGDILQINNVDATGKVTNDGVFGRINSGYIKTSGLDYQAGYRLDTGLFGGSTLRTDLYVNYLLSYETQQVSYLPGIDYAGTISYFGAGLGTTLPEIKANLNTSLSIGDWDIALRARYIDGMSNRIGAEFIGETSPTGVGSVTYWDSSVTYSLFENATVRLGVNNLFDKQPPTYAPNVQSGTDPSQYDVIGRRYQAAIQVKF